MQGHNQRIKREYSPPDRRGVKEIFTAHNIQPHRSISGNN